MSLPPIYRKYAYQWRVSQVVLVYGLHRLSRVLTSTGQRSFSFHGPTVWNSLPSALRDDSLSLNTFSRQLKTYLFGQ